MKAIGENKRCSNCGEWKHVSAFGSDTSRRDGLFNHCKACRLAAYRAKHGERAPRAPFDRSSYDKRWREVQKRRRDEYREAYTAALLSTEDGRERVAAAIRTKAKEKWMRAKLREMLHSLEETHRDVHRD